MKTLLILLLSTFFCFSAADVTAQNNGLNQNKGNSAVATPGIVVNFTCTSAEVASTKHDLSNVVLLFSDSTTQKYDGLKGKTGVFAGTGANMGKYVIGVWVKAGDNLSGDCPGCGQFFPTTRTDCNGIGSGHDDDEIIDTDKKGKKVKICHVPKGNPANAHTIIVSEKAAKAHINRHGGDYYGECKPNTGGGNGNNNAVVNINCLSTSVTATVNIETITLLLDDSSMQVFTINAKTATVKPNGAKEGYFVRGAFVQLYGGTTITTIKGQQVRGTYYKNTCYQKKATPVVKDEHKEEEKCVSTGTATAKNITYKVNGKVVSTLAGNVKEGNLVEVTFTLSGTEATRYSLVAYNAPKRNYSEQNALENEVFDYDSEEFGPGVHTMSVTVPNNYFQVDFVKGCVIWKFGPMGTNNFYEKENRLISRANGGEKDCCKTCDENKKVTICHVPKGNPANAHTITISKAAAKAHIGRHGGDYYGECKPLPGTGVSGSVKAEFTCTSVKITSTGAPLAYVVLVFTDGSRQKFENLSGFSGTFAGTGANEGKTIAGVYAKATTNVATDCNGCGDYIKNTADCGGGGENPTAEVDVNCTAVVVSSPVIIQTITLAFDDGTFQTFEINAKTANVSPINEYEGYFIMGAYIQLQGNTTETVTEYGEVVYGDYYENPNFEECDELVEPALPVTLTKFQATKIEPSVVKLEWATSSETNNDYIAIERSSDIENWKEVCRVPSAAPGGNSQHVHDYSCYDHSADEDGQNIVYYRPKQVDLNGTFEYHNTIRLRLMDAAYATEIQSVYPNPATDRLNIRYNTAENGTINLRLISLDGKSLLQNRFVAKPGVQTYDLDLMEDKLKPGLYVLEIQTEGEVFRQKVYKQ